MSAQDWQIEKKTQFPHFGYYFQEIPNIIPHFGGEGLNQWVHIHPGLILWDWGLTKTNCQLKWSPNQARHSLRSSVRCFGFRLPCVIYVIVTLHFQVHPDMGGNVSKTSEGWPWWWSRNPEPPCLLHLSNRLRVTKSFENWAASGPSVLVIGTSQWRSPDMMVGVGESCPHEFESGCGRTCTAQIWAEEHFFSLLQAGRGGNAQCWI